MRYFNHAFGQLFKKLDVNAQDLTAVQELLDAEIEDEEELPDITKTDTDDVTESPHTSTGSDTPSFYSSQPSQEFLYRTTTPTTNKNIESPNAKLSGTNQNPC
mmetsp:Transcript_23494/g.35680  ORF Transcript_23494/g.35680 Transcript_23494/m.35680 type:complete len:103 (+) Transcript_23494:1896-2204(+)